jgi:hypothetical protein
MFTATREARRHTWRNFKKRRGCRQRGSESRGDLQSCGRRRPTNRRRPAAATRETMPVRPSPRASSSWRPSQAPWMPRRSRKAARGLEDWRRWDGLSGKIKYLEDGFIWCYEAPCRESMQRASSVSGPALNKLFWSNFGRVIISRSNSV